VGKGQAQHTKIREVRDPIHGFITFPHGVARVVDTRPFQRLRRIQQLARADLVYPGATHTRFEHSLGVMHIAIRIADKVLSAKRDKKTVALAALLHDVGHGPFSHVSELVYKQYNDPEKSTEYDGYHEYLTSLIIKHDTDIKKTVTRYFRDRVIAILRKEPDDWLLKDIVSGPLDADKIDYLQRDGHYAGVKYGVFDADNLIVSLQRVDLPPISRLGISFEGVLTLDQFRLAKHFITHQVYRHRIRRVTDAMLIRAMQKSIESGDVEMGKLFTVEDSRKYIMLFLRHNDETVAEMLRKSKSPSAKDIQGMLDKRTLLKEVVRIRLHKPMDVNLYSKLLQIGKDQQLRKRLENALSRHLNCNGDFVIVEKWDRKDPTFEPPHTQLRPEEIVVKTPEGLRRYTDESSVIDEVADVNKTTFVSAYAIPDDIDKWVKDSYTYVQDSNEFACQFLLNGG
jgi:HD superfamily phosphohydrolase